MRCVHSTALWALLITMACPALAAGQHRRPPASVWGAIRGSFAGVQAEGPPRPLTPTLLSLTVPGAGQHVLGQRRKWAYLALEIVGWAFYLERRSAGSGYRDQYRDFAWEQGRIQSGSRIDGDFNYYETLSKWTRSGSFDRDPTLLGVQPELDGQTYNGSIWTLASQIFLPAGMGVPVSDPAYQSALAYYLGRAYGTDLLWDWSGAPGAQQEFTDLIEASDARFRQATTAVGVVIANHLLSAVDAYLATRGRQAPVRLRLVPGSGAFGPSWFAVLSVSVGR